MAKSALIKKQLEAAKSVGIDKQTLTLTLAPERVPEVALATRVPQELHHRMRVHCVTNKLRIQDFVAKAIEAALGD
jgi:DNA-binding XRE family transcriptional regulator